MAYVMRLPSVERTDQAMTDRRSYNPSEVSREQDDAARHPAVAAWNEFRAARNTMFAGSAKGWHLEHRLHAAFEEGWNAAARAILLALGRVGEQRDGKAASVELFEYHSEPAADEPDRPGDRGHRRPR
jgi:hypothetical protein